MGANSLVTTGVGLVSRATGPIGVAVGALGDLFGAGHPLDAARYAKVETAYRAALTGDAQALRQLDAYATSLATQGPKDRARGYAAAVRVKLGLTQAAAVADAAITGAGVGIASQQAGRDIGAAVRGIPWWAWALAGGLVLVLVWKRSG